MDESEPVVSLLLVRHGLADTTGGTLTGRTPGVHLNERGATQAAGLAQRLSGLTLDAVVSSPLERCRETAAAVAGVSGNEVLLEDGISECDYGDWTGRELRSLTAEPLWRVVQNHPSAARFPGGESLAEVSHRAVAAVRGWNTWLLGRSHSPVYVMCSHGDVIKAIVADALGVHLDQFQRISIDPCSLTAIRYTATRPFVQRLNDVGATAAGLEPAEGAASSDAVVGGGSGGPQTEESLR